MRGAEVGKKTETAGSASAARMRMLASVWDAGRLLTSQHHGISSVTA